MSPKCNAGFLAGGFLFSYVRDLRPLTAIPLDAISASLHTPLRGTPRYALRLRRSVGEREPLVTPSHSRIAGPLSRLVAEGRGAELLPDPVAFPHRYADRRDAEAAAFIAASFAFGGVLQILNFLSRLFDALTAQAQVEALRKTG